MYAWTRDVWRATGYPRAVFGYGLPLWSLLVGCDGYGLILLPSLGVSTVANATWNASPDVQTRLVVTDDDGVQLTSSWQPAEAATVAMPVVGMRPDHAYTMHVEADAGDQGQAVAYQTGSRPSKLPGWASEGTPSWRGFAVSTLLGADNWAVVWDESGHAVWAYDIPETGSAMRARARVAGDGIWYANAILSESDDLPELIAIDWNGDEIERVTVNEYSHDFVELSDGTLAFLLFEPETIDGQVVIGNRIIERARSNGAETEVWSAFDIWTPGVHGNIASEGGWLGGNALDINADETVYTAGFRAVDGILDIDRGSGEVSRQVGGPTPTYTFINDENPKRQHQFEWVGEDLLVFDNRESGEDSRVAQYAFDVATGSAELVWSYQHEPPMWCFSLGDVTRDVDGSTLVTWSSAGVMDDVDSDGELAWTLSTEFGSAIGFLSRQSSIAGFDRSP